MKHRLWIIAAACLLMGEACSLAGPSAPGPREVRRFGGRVTMAGSNLAATLELRGPDRNLEAALRIPDLNLTAQGAGGISGSRLDLLLTYADTSACAGKVHVRGQLESDGQRVEGTITAGDCTGTETGTVLFLLREPRDESGTIRPGHIEGDPVRE